MRTRVAIFGAFVGLTMSVGLLAACGGGGSGPGNTGPSDGQAAFQAYADCLSQHGVTVARPSRGPRPSDRPSGVRPSGRGGFPGNGFGGIFGSEAPPGVDQRTWDAAQQACASLRPSVGPRGGNNSAFQAYRNCLREHGVTASAGPGDVNTADPKVAAALATCAPLRPTGRPGPSAS